MLRIDFRFACIYNWPWPILKAKAKVMHILTADVLEMMNDTANQIITIVYEVVYRL